MSRIQVYVLLICLTMMFGCVAPKPSLIPPKHINEKNYEIGEEYSANTGSPMIRIMNASTWNSYTPRYEHVFNNKYISPGQTWCVRYNYKGHNVVCNNDFYDNNLGILIDNDGYIPENKMALINLPMLLSQNVMNRPLVGTERGKLDVEDVHLFKKHDVKCTKSGSFKAVLIYDGKSNDTISISYREFKDDFARPAFYQNMNYELSDSNTISFRTIKMEIIDYSNESIRFRVLEDQGLPWMPYNP